MPWNRTRLHCLKLCPRWGDSSLPIPFGLLAIKQVIDSYHLSPALRWVQWVQPGVAFMTQQKTPWQSCKPSLPCPLITRQTVRFSWVRVRLQCLRRCLLVWNPHASLHSAPLYKENYSHYDFSCWVEPKLLQGINEWLNGFSLRLKYLLSSYKLTA